MHYNGNNESWMQNELNSSMLDLIRNKIKTLKEDAVSDVKSKHVDELERLKTRQERELEQLKQIMFQVKLFVEEQTM